MDETAGYEVWSGGSLVGVLREVSVDMPWFRGEFVPGAEWDAVDPLFAAQEDVRRQGFPEHLAGALRAVRDLEVELPPAEGGEPIRPWMIWIADGRASFRH